MKTKTKTALTISPLCPCQFVFCPYLYLPYPCLSLCRYLVSFVRSFHFYHLHLLYPYHHCVAAFSCPFPRHLVHSFSYLYVLPFLLARSSALCLLVVLPPLPPSLLS